MKIGSERPELFHVDEQTNRRTDSRWTDGQDVANSRFFANFGRKAPPPPKKKKFPDATLLQVIHHFTKICNYGYNFHCALRKQFPGMSGFITGGTKTTIQANRLFPCPNIFINQHSAFDGNRFARSSC